MWAQIKALIFEVTSCFQYLYYAKLASHLTDRRESDIDLFIMSWQDSGQDTFCCFVLQLFGFEIKQWLSG